MEYLKQWRNLTGINMILFGASGHAKVVADCLKDAGESVTVFVDDDPSKVSFMEKEVIPSVRLTEFDEKVVISIGDNKIRKKIANSIKVKFGSVAHPSVLISSTSTYKEGTVIFHGSIIQAGVVIGKHSIINTKVSVDHDCQIGDFVHVGPGTVLCGSVVVGDGSFIGAGSVVKQGIIIGSDVIIGAGSVIIKDIPDNCIVVGNPGRILRINNE